MTQGEKLNGTPRACQHNRDTREAAKWQKNTSVLDIYADRKTVLHKAGYRPADIAVLTADNPGSKDFAHEKSSKAGEGAAAGAAVGAVAGALVGWALSTGLVAIPGLEPLATVRPLIAALAAAGFGSTSGWLIGLFLGFGAPGAARRNCSVYCI